MRLKDETKRSAIRSATIRVVNQLGLEGASVSKIAKEADISAASIYTYFDNKDNMMAALNTELKAEMWQATMQGIDMSAGHENLFRTGWMAHYDYSISNAEVFRFVEQYASCSAPRADLPGKVQEQYTLLHELYRRAIQDGAMRDMPNELISAYLFAPLKRLATLKLNGAYQPTQAILNEAFDAAWRGISVG
jgi:AcrR family transcriptional regulator